MSENVEIYTTGKSFRLPPAVVTAGTNLSEIISQSQGSQVQIADGGVPQKWARYISSRFWPLFYI